MKISIITATYNSSLTIQNTLDSIAEQTYGDIEHLIIDGASKDNTLDLVAQYSHVAVVSSQKDEGIYDAMNRGISLAKGDIIGILNSDDYYADARVLEWVAQIFTDKKVDAVYGDLIYFKGVDHRNVLRYWKSGPFRKKNFLLGWMPPHPTFFVRKEIYDKYGGFLLDMGSAADYEFMLRVLYKKNCSVAYIPKVLVNMRDGGESNASLNNRIKANRMDREAWRINGIKPRFYTLLMKPLGKIKQFYLKNNNE